MASSILDRRQHHRWPEPADLLRPRPVDLLRPQPTDLLDCAGAPSPEFIVRDLIAFEGLDYFIYIFIGT
jgi:hypothetical protein